MVTDPRVVEAVAALKPKTVDQFSGRVIDGAERALADEGNPLRLNFFSTAMRILFEHMMDMLAPREDVIQCGWFKRKKGEEDKPRRSERILFAIRGGLSEEFVRQNLHIDASPLCKRLLTAIDELSKHIHGRENTVILDASEQDTVAAATVAAMGAFLDTMGECRAAVLEPIAQALDEAAVDALITETIGDIDELASHHSLEEVDVEDLTVERIGPATITYRAKGSVSVVLQWGSNSDVSRGDGIELPQTFPFYCDIEVPLEELWDLSFAEINYGVDTGDWREADALDDRDR
jgi:Predicted pPIWI-associating nuclease